MIFTNNFKMIQVYDEFYLPFLPHLVVNIRNAHQLVHLLQKVQNQFQDNFIIFQVP